VVTPCAKVSHNTCKYFIPCTVG